MKIVVKVGGSIAIDEKGPRYSYLSELLPILKKIDEKQELSVGIGGGRTVRNYSGAISGFDLTGEEAEECFIQLIKANVLLFSYLLDKDPLYSFEGYEGGEVVVGGVKPGRSTDANAAQVAADMGADLFIILTNVDGIYDKDPAKYEDAEKIEEVGFNEVDRLKSETSPTNYGVVDPTALDIIRENRIKTAVIDGRDPENILRVMEGERLGTIIS